MLSCEFHINTPTKKHEALLFCWRLQWTFRIRVNTHTQNSFPICLLVSAQLVSAQMWVRTASRWVRICPTYQMRVFCCTRAEIVDRWSHVEAFMSVCVCFIVFLATWAVAYDCRSLVIVFQLLFSIQLCYAVICTFSLCSDAWTTMLPTTWQFPK